MCQQSKHHTPNRTMTHNSWSQPSPDPILNTLPSISGYVADTHTHTHVTAVMSHLLTRSHQLAVSPSLPRPVHLFRSLFPRVYLQLPAYSHMALLTRLCHTHPTCRVPPLSDRCCSLQCSSHVPTCQRTFRFG